MPKQRSSTRLLKHIRSQTVFYLYSLQGGRGGLTLASSDNPFSDTVGTPSRLAYSMNTVCYSTLENLTKKETLLWQTGYSPQPPTWWDQDQILCMRQPSGGNSKFQVSSKPGQWFRSCGGQNLPFAIAMANGLYNTTLYKLWLGHCIQFDVLQIL